MNRNRNAIFAVALVLTMAAPTRPFAQDTPSATTEAKPLGVLHNTELEKLIPSAVYFQGQSATVQIRNSGGVRFSGGAVMFTVKVDTGGYSTAIKERYQDYLITETPLLLGDGADAKRLAPGAYGIGFLDQGLVVMDIGGHTLFTISSPTDKDLRRPSPLQVLAHDATFRIYSGRTYISFTAAP